MWVFFYNNNKYNIYNTVFDPLNRLQKIINEIIAVREENNNLDNIQIYIINCLVFLHQTLKKLI